YYFEPVREEAPADGEPNGAAVVIARPRTIPYRPLNMASSEIHVVWQPKKKSTGEVRGHWTHRAIGLRFHRVSPDQWVLSMRPEHHEIRDIEHEMEEWRKS